MSDDESPSSSFHLFPQLPSKLQILVWEYALAAAPKRAITVIPWKNTGARKGHYKRLKGPQSPNVRRVIVPPIPLLAIDHLSRSVALRVYRRGLGEFIGKDLYFRRGDMVAVKGGLLAVAYLLREEQKGFRSRLERFRAGAGELGVELSLRMDLIDEWIGLERLRGS